MANPLCRLPQSIEMMAIVKASLDGKGGTQLGKTLIYCKGLDGGAVDCQMNRPRNPGIPQAFNRESATLGDRQTHPDTRQVARKDYNNRDIPAGEPEKRVTSSA